MKKLLNNILQNNVPRPVPFLSREFFYRVNFFLSREIFLIARIASYRENRFLSRVSLRKSQHDACHGHSCQSIRIIEIRQDLNG